MRSSTTEETSSTHTVENDNKEVGFQPRQSWSNNGGGWKKSPRVSDSDKEQVKARWSFNVGNSVRDLGVDYDEDEDEEDDEQQWLSSNTINTAKPAMVKEEEEKEEVQARWSFNSGGVIPAPDNDDEEEGEMWVSSRNEAAVPPKIEEEEEDPQKEPEHSLDDIPTTEEEKKQELSLDEPPRFRPRPKYRPNPLIPKTPTDSTTSSSKILMETPKRMYMELCGETCEEEFRKMTMEATSPTAQPPSRRHSIAVPEVERQLSLSVGYRKPRRTVSTRDTRLDRRNSIQESMRNLRLE